MLGQNIGRVGLPDMSSGGRPSLTLDFVGIPVLNERITFSRTSGATWFSPDGVLEGVDFSTSSVAIGTGSKTFTLTADAGANRYWAVGDLVRVSQQSNSANFMEGTVTSYTVSTQVLVIDITSTGGSGTIASWRVSSHMPRFDFNPTTLAAQGLLIEEQRTNSIRNNTMVGAVAGTPGTLPTNWAAQAVGGVALTEVVGTGTENGITYIDLRYTGTTSSTTAGGILTESSTQITAASGQTWASSFYVRLVGGSTSGITDIFNAIQERDAAGALLASTNTTISPTGAALNTQRPATTRLLTNASTARITQQIRLVPASGVAIDITLRIGLPQLELGAFATSVIPTTVAQVTRNADQASVNTLSPWFNATEGTLFAEWIAQAFTHRPATFNDGTQNNAIALVGTATNIGSNVFVSNVFQGTVTVSGTFTTGTTYKQATAYKLNDTQDFANGVAATTDTTILIPTVTQLLLGAGRSGMASTPGNGWLRRLTYYPRRLSQAEGIAITTP